MPTEPHYRAADLSRLRHRPVRRGRLRCRQGLGHRRASGGGRPAWGTRPMVSPRPAPISDELESGAMAKTGEPTVIADRPAAVTWDGGFLPGVWLVRKALDLAAETGTEISAWPPSPSGAAIISAALPFYLRQATERQLMCIVACSDPSDATMAPFGGTKPVFTPDPDRHRHSDQGRSDHGRYQLFHHDQRHDRAAEARRQALSRQMGARQPRASRPTIRGRSPAGGTLLPTGGA